MWKVSNNKNSCFLRAFRITVINPLFTMLKNYKAELSTIDFKDYIANNRSIKQVYRQALLYVLDHNDTYKEKTFHNYIIELLCNLTQNEIKTQYEIFTEQTNCLSKFDYSPQKYKNNKYFKVLFNNFFFEIFFNDNALWEIIDLSFKDYGKLEFHKNFQAENDISVCPYCDIDTIYGDFSKDIEHYLPKNSYPYLAMHENNLFSACKSCNSASGKSNRLPIGPIDTPYSFDIGKQAKFSSDIKSQTILLENSNKISINNYYTLLKLQDRYKEESIYKSIHMKGLQVYDIISQDKCPNTTQKMLDFKKYILLKREPLTIAICSIYDSWDEYSTYIKRKPNI